MRLRISDEAEAIGALSSGVHPNRVAARLTYPVLPPIPLGHCLNSIDGVMFPLTTPKCMCGHPNCYSLLRVGRQYDKSKTLASK